MAKNDKGNQVTAGGATYGPAEGQGAADVLQENVGPSRDAADYVLVTKYHPEADGLRIEEQVLKSEFEGKLSDDNVSEAHPAANRPTSDLTEEEAKREGRS